MHMQYIFLEFALPVGECRGECYILGSFLSPVNYRGDRHTASIG